MLHVSLDKFIINRGLQYIKCHTVYMSFSKIVHPKKESRYTFSFTQDCLSYYIYIFCHTGLPVILDLHFLSQRTFCHWIYIFCHTGLPVIMDIHFLSQRTACRIVYTFSVTGLSVILDI